MITTTMCVFCFMIVFFFFFHIKNKIEKMLKVGTGAIFTILVFVLKEDSPIDVALQKFRFV